jgi:Protein of unknown function (DUF3102)
VSEIAKQEAKRLDALAERINEEHRAYDAALKHALGHVINALARAMDAGDLLLEAKERCPHGTWLPWLEANFEGSARRAQEYMYLARNRGEIEELKARGSAFFTSVDHALGFLRSMGEYARGQGPMGPPPVLGSEPLLPHQEKLQVMREREEQRLHVRAEYAIRTGNMDLPADVKVSPGAWEQAVWRAVQLRGENIPNVIDALGHELGILVHHAPPEKVGRYLVEPTNDYDEAENRNILIAELREGIAWLQRVLEEAEAVRGREG